jgi:cell division protein FtsL
MLIYFWALLAVCLSTLIHGHKSRSAIEADFARAFSELADLKQNVKNIGSEKKSLSDASRQSLDRLRGIEKQDVATMRAIAATKAKEMHSVVRQVLAAVGIDA